MITLSACKDSKNADGKDDDEQKAQKESTQQQEKQQEKGITEKMAKEHTGDKPKPTGAIDSEPRQPVTSETLSYGKVDGTEVAGYIAEPENAEKNLPGIIVIHEWWGLNDNIRKMTDKLAGLGYRALAVDLYRGKIADSPDKAKELMKGAMGRKTELKDNLKQAYDYLVEETDSKKIASIGWCFGGGWSLQTALIMPAKLDAAVIYYGELVTDEKRLEKLEMPLLGFFGTEDSAIPMKTVKKFEKTLEKLGKDAQIHTYKGAGHAFANPSGKTYEPRAATDAWKKTGAFLAEYLKE
jgi:carboxymethylenebutenolidase